MKIFYITDIFPTVSQVFISRELAALERLGAKITMFSLQKPQDGISHALNNHLRINLLWEPDLRKNKIAKAADHLAAVFSNPKAYREALGRAGTAGLPPMQYFFRQLPFYCSLIKESGAQRIHCHFGRMGMLVGWLASCMLDLPFSVTLHGTDILMSPYNNLGAVLNDADLVICVSEKIKSVAKSRYKISPNKLAVIPCGLTVGEYPLNLLNKKQKRLNILCVARLHPVKGLNDLILACFALRNRGFKFTCFIVGDGQLKEMLQEQVVALELRKFVRFLGAIPNEKLPQVYSESSVFVLPSYSEGLSVVIMEAMASGLPIVATNVGGIPELVQDGKNGYLVAPGKPAGLANAIEKVFGLSRADKVKMRQMNRLKVKKYFNSQIETAKLLNLFKRNSNIYGEPLLQ
ncbi:MAG: glycosyltransferase [Desulfobacteraceae bacterium]|nr:glycosyltransferase [Desulfobacteraceae bacterium]